MKRYWIAAICVVICLPFLAEIERRNYFDVLVPNIESTLYARARTILASEYDSNLHISSIYLGGSLSGYCIDKYQVCVSDTLFAKTDHIYADGVDDRSVWELFQNCNSCMKVPGKEIYYRSIDIPKTQIIAESESKTTTIDTYYIPYRVNIMRLDYIESGKVVRVFLQAKVSPPLLFNLPIGAPDQLVEGYAVDLLRNRIF